MGIKRIASPQEQLSGLRIGRFLGEHFTINDELKIQVIGIQNNQVWFAINGPKEKYQISRDANQKRVSVLKIPV